MISSQRRILFLAAVAMVLMLSICIVESSDDSDAASDSFWYGGMHYQKLTDGYYEIDDVKESQIGSTITIKDIYYNGTCKVQSIGDNVFEGITKLKSVTLSGSLETIGDYAFCDCTSLTTVKFSANSIRTIGDGTFYGCTALETLTFGSSNSVATIGSYAFADCSSLKSFTISFTTSPSGKDISYGDHVFDGCTSLEYVDSSMEYSFGDLPFKGCSSFKGLRTVDAENKTGTYGPVYSSQSKNYLRCYPAAMEDTEYSFDEELTDIADCAFEGTKYLQKLTITSNVTSISIASDTERGAFTDCTSIKTLSIEGASTTSTYYMYNKTVLTYNDKDNNKKIMCWLSPSATDSSGKKVTSVSVTTEFTDIAPYAFYKCVNLTEIKFNAGGSLETIGDYAFQESGIAEFALGNNMKNTVVLGDKVFLDCTELMKFTSTGISIIPAYTFSGCSKLNNLELTGITEVGDRAFYNCTSLANVSFPSSIETIYCTPDDTTDPYSGTCTVFDGCSSLNAITVGSGCKAYFVESGALCHTIDYLDKTVLIKYPALRSEASCTIATANEVAPKAFYGCSMLVSVIIDNTTWDDNSIKTDAFRGCTSLTEIVNRSYDNFMITAGSEENGCIGLYTTSDGRFIIQDEDTPSQVYTATLDGVGKAHFIKDGEIDLLLKYIGDNTEISFPVTYEDDKKVTHTRYVVYTNAFLNNSAITKVTMSSGLAYMDAGAFTNCSALSMLDIGTYTGTIDNRAFAECNALTRIVADNDVYKANEDETDYVLFTKDMSVLMMYPYARSDTSYNIDVSVGSYAFYNCKNLTSINMRSFVTVLEDHAFMNCTGLTSVIIPLKVETVGEDVFAGCDNITSIMMPLRLDARIFSSCTKLTELTFIGEGDECFEYTKDTVKKTPWYMSTDTSITVTVGNLTESSLTALKGYLFYGCTSIVSVTLSNTMASVGENVFYGNTNLKTMSLPITLDASGMYNCNKLAKITFTAGFGDGLGIGHDYDSSSSKKTPWYSSATRITEFVLEEGIRTIGEYAFAYNQNTGTLQLCDSIDTVSRYAFYNSDFSGVTFGSSGNLTLIGEYAFSGSSISGYLDLKDGLRTVGDYAFKDCKSLSSVNIPWTVIDNEYFGTGIFNGCTKISMIYLPVTLDSTDILDDCSSIKSITLKAGSDSDGNKTGISRSYTEEESKNTLWYRASNLDPESLYISDDVTSISDNMFRGAASIKTSVSVGDSITSIGAYAFADCINLTDFGGLLNKARTIGDYAFLNCKNVTSLTVSDSIESIGTGAFTGCTGITELSTPVNIDASPFNDCIYLEKVIFTKGNGDTQGIGFDYTDVTCQSLPWYKSRATLTRVTVESGVTDLGNYLLYNCYNVSLVIFSVDVESIGDYTFGQCISLSGSLILPEKLKSIGQYAFIGCNGISIIELPESVQSVDVTAFSGCNSVNELQFPIYINALAFSGCFDGGEHTKELRLLCGTEDNAGIGYSYTEDEYSQLPWALLTDSFTVSIYSGVKSIGSHMFHGCYAVTVLNIPASVISIGDSAFSGCLNLTTITFTGSETGVPEKDLEFGDSSFKGTAFSSVILPDRVVSIGAYAFEGCDSMRSMTISDTSQLRSIGEYAFAHNNLTAINIPANITEIPGYAFYCSSLTEIKFVKLSNLLHIGDCAFAYTQLETFTIPDSIKTVGTDIFNMCNRLTSITVPVDINLVCLHGMDCLTDVEFTSGSTARCLDYFEDGLQSYKDLPWNSSTHGGLISVYFGKDIGYIGKNLFNGAEDLSHIEYYTERSDLSGETRYLSYITEIGACAFKNCSSLDEIIIPDGVVTVGEDAFFGCTRAGNISISRTVQSLGESPFRSCSNLYSISVDSGNAVYTSLSGALFNISMSKLLKYPCMNVNAYVLPSSVEQISAYAFEGGSLAGITFREDSDSENESSLTIGPHAFEYCSNISSLVFPDAVRAVGEYAFHGCTSVTEMKFYGSAVSMDTMSFALGLPDSHVTCNVYSDDEISLVYYSDSNTTFNYKQSNYKITFNWNNGSTVVECGRGAEIKLPKDPESYNDTVFKYVFSSWDGYTEGMIAVSDMTFNALYDAEYVGYSTPTSKESSVILEPDNCRTVTIPSSIVKKIKDDVWNKDVSELIVKTVQGSITLDANSLYYVSVKDITVSILETEKSDLPESIAKAVGDRTVYSINFGDEHEFSGNVTISILYEIQEGEYEDKFVMWHMSENGSYTEIKAKHIDGSLKFDTNSLSYFAVSQSQGGDDPKPVDPGQSSEGLPVYVYIIIAAVVVLAAAGIFVYIKKRK